MKIHIIFQGQLISHSATSSFQNILSTVPLSFTTSVPENFVLYDPEAQKIFDSSSFTSLATSTKQEIYLFVKDRSELPDFDSNEESQPQEDRENIFEIKLEPAVKAIQDAWKQNRIKIAEDLDKLITVQAQCIIGDNLRNLREKVKRIASKFIPKLPDRLEEEKQNTRPTITLENDKPIEKKVETITEKEKPSPNISSADSRSPKSEIDIKKRTTTLCWSFKEEILELFRKDQIFIIEGPKGIGKTTQIPEFILEELKGGQYATISTLIFRSDKKITVVGTYEVLAKLGADRVAKDTVKNLICINLQGRGVGEVVGYSLLFEEECTDISRITYTTYEKLFRQTSQDPRLSKYFSRDFNKARHHVLILDDIHLRTKYSDSVCDYVKKIRKTRIDLKVIITCAQDEGKKLQQYFECNLLTIPVTSPSTEIYYTAEPEVNYIESAARSVIQIHTTEQPGNILVFLPKPSDLHLTEKFIKKMLKNIDKAAPLLIIPIHEDQCLEEITSAFGLIWSKDPKIMKMRKCILGTDMLETSLSVGDIRYVVDTGYTQEKNFSCDLGVEYKQVVYVSQAKAVRRSHATSINCKETKCFRLFTQKSFKNDLDEETDAELMKSDLSIIILLFAKLGIKEILSLEADVITSAVELLNYIEAFDDENNVTEFGDLLLQFPTSPQLAVSIISSSSYNCCESVLTIAAMLSSQSCFYDAKEIAHKAREAQFKFANNDGDLFTYLTIYNLFKTQENQEDWCRAHYLDYSALLQAKDIREKLVNILNRNKIEISEDLQAKDHIDNIKKCLLLGHVKQVAVYDKASSTYKLLKDGNSVVLYPSPLMLHKPEICIYNEVVMSATQVNIKIITSVKREYLIELVPDYLKTCKVSLEN